MTRDELRAAIGRAICDLKDRPGECAFCEAHGYQCPDSWPDLKAKTDAIITLVEGASQRMEPTRRHVRPA